MPVNEYGELILPEEEEPANENTARDEDADTDSSTSSTSSTRAGQDDAAAILAYPLPVTPIRNIVIDNAGTNPALAPQVATVYSWYQNRVIRLTIAC